MPRTRSRDASSRSEVLRLVGVGDADLLSVGALHQAASRHLPPRQAEALVRLSKPAARLRASDGKIGTSRLGGHPHLEDIVQWPDWDGRPLNFLAVLDLEELQGLDVGIRLPASGYLNFFYDAEEKQPWGFDPSESDGWRVLYAPPGRTALTTTPADTFVFDEVPLEFVQIHTLPDYGEHPVVSIREAASDAFDAFADDFYADGGWPEEPRHQIGGWPNLVQGSLWLEAQLASHGMYLGDGAAYQTPRARELSTGAGDWRLLLQLDSDDAVPWMWGDAGTLYFVQTETSLLQEDFAAAWLILQCG